LRLFAKFVTLFAVGLIFLLALAYTTAYKKLKQAKALKINAKKTNKPFRCTRILD